MEAGHIIQNGTVFAGDAEGLVDNDDNSINEMTGIYFFGLNADLATLQDFDLLPANVVISELEATLPEGHTVTEFFKNGSDAEVTVVAAGANTVGADLTAFESWSWTEVSGSMDEF
jgi:hypothetical protein